MPQHAPIIGFRLSEEEVKSLRQAAEVVEWLRVNAPIQSGQGSDRMLKTMINLLIDIADLETF